ncbi:MAG: hypothetical protein KJ600_04490 [Nanoarchaeota archaeon]|nr:hypothetical protein [Nanoarchaeota archaeon]MBU1103786.1 hypothetical protein [Nanoarchaeota archaeon]
MQISTITILLAAAAFIIVIWLTYKLAVLRADLKWQKNLVSLRKSIADQQRAGIKGKVSETFAPFLGGFPFKPSECKFLGDPIDYVAFEGLDERDVKGVHFVEVKQGTSKLSKHQKQIKDLIDDLKSDEVTFKEFRFED